MTQVSRRPLDKKVLNRIFEIFVSSFVCVKNKPRAESFLSELFSQTERIMIAKRLTIAFLLSKKYSFESIKSLLKVSQTTICKVNYYVNQEKSGYKTILKDVEKNLEDGGIEYILGIINTILPPLRGSNWKEERKKQYAHLRDLEKPF